MSNICCSWPGGKLRLVIRSMVVAGQSKTSVGVRSFTPWRWRWLIRGGVPTPPTQRSWCALCLMTSDLDWHSWQLTDRRHQVQKVTCMQMAAASAASIGGAVKKALLQVGLLPAEITAGIGAPPECGVAAEWLPKPDPAPYGLASWTKLRWAEDIPRNRWVISFVQQAVDMAEMYQLPMGTGGWVQIRALFWRFPQLHEACFGTAHFLARLVVKDQTRALDAKVVSGRVAVRRINALERLQGFVEDYASRLPPAAHLSVAELMGTSLVGELWSELPQKPLLECLRPCALFDVNPSARGLTLRPAADRLRLGLERLFRHPETGRLHAQLSETGSVPLSSLLRYFGQRLLGGVRFSPQQALEALSSSKELLVDPKTLTVHVQEWHKYNLSMLPKIQEVPANKERLIHLVAERRGRWRRTSTFSSQLSDKQRVRRRFREILDFYMHPFNIQHNCLLRHGADEGSWAWPLHRLAADFPRVEVLVSLIGPQEMPSFLEAVCQEPAEYMDIVSNWATEEPVVKP
ncbi:unnamed protein product [Durusdinium trenchii]